MEQLIIRATDAFGKTAEHKHAFDGDTFGRMILYARKRGLTFDEGHPLVLTIDKKPQT